MVIDFSDLPQRYQAQALKQVAEREHSKNMSAMKTKCYENTSSSKYRNKKTTRTSEDGAVLCFDSQKEARRYDYLLALERAGEIKRLRLQVDFTLQEAYTDTNGKRIRAIRYKADFTYLERNKLVVEDVKSRPTRTKDYIMKKKMLKDRFGIDISEV